MNQSGLSIILQYFPELSATQRAHFAKLGELYAAWNERVNLISRKDFEHLYERHILHSLGIAKVVLFKKGTRIVDVGTGGGHTAAHPGRDVHRGCGAAATTAGGQRRCRDDQGRKSGQVHASTPHGRLGAPNSSRGHRAATRPSAPR